MSAFEKLKASLRESIWEQEQVIQLRLKFAELDPKSQAIVQLSSIVVAIFMLLGLLGVLITGSMARNAQIAEKEALINYVKEASTKIEASRRSGSASLQGNAGINSNAPLSELLEQISMKASIGRGSIEVGDGDPAILKLSRVSIRQLVRVFYTLENQLPGVEWKKLTLDSRGDKKGYLWADIEVHRAGAK